MFVARVMATMAVSKTSREEMFPAEWTTELLKSMEKPLVAVSAPACANDDDRRRLTGVWSPGARYGRRARDGIHGHYRVGAGQERGQLRCRANGVGWIRETAGR